MVPSSPDRKHGNERERIHAAQVSLAIGHIHGSPHEACAGRGQKAPERMRRNSAARPGWC